MKEFVYILVVISVAFSGYGEAFAVSPDMVTGSGITTGGPGATDTREDMIFYQSHGPGGNSAWGSMWYEALGTDGKAADNFQVETAFDGYVLTAWDEWMCLWYGTWDSSKGCWCVIFEDGGTTPATYEPYEYGENPGWHDDVADGNGGLDYVTDTVAVDYWEWDDVTGTGSVDFYLWGYYPVYKTGARIEDVVCDDGPWAWAIPSSDIYWWCVQFYADPAPYGGPTDNTVDVIPPGLVQFGWTGTSWDPKPYPMMFNLYGEPGEDIPPEITDMYPQDGDYPSGVPVDTLAGCHWTEPDPDDTGINVSNSTFDLYDSNMDLVLGMLTVDDTDLWDVIVDFEPDDDLNEGETYTVETFAEDLAGNSATESWQFTTGYVNITPESLGGIKARFAE
ncbi:MAG: hypothetical protein JSW52_07670 [Candidatus Coatesbacteria bacterium]|nr:MAG: hypothetical protein JSW52_07670 [Candidatus Coatesbacteria bacterium]